MQGLRKAGCAGMQGVRRAAVGLRRACAGSAGAAVQQQQVQQEGFLIWSWVGSSRRSHGSSRSWQRRTSAGDWAGAAAHQGQGPCTKGLGGRAVQRQRALTLVVIRQYMLCAVLMA
jgi:hypothetical protein